MGILILGIVGVLVHVVFLYSIFDIYFRSPLITGLQPYAVPFPAPAKRVVLFVADGLRADKFFQLDEEGNSRAPFLRDIIFNKGSWGVSHTRVPTESRPGHVAIIAGFYEDVSAVTKGWRENPIEFDSLLNESRYSWAWGSPDILLMFAKGASNGIIHTHTYKAEEEDFARKNPSDLDIWVFNKFQDFLTEAKNNQTLNRMLHEDKVIFFLHLLGLDTTGHSHKPRSKKYLQNIHLVDQGIQRCMVLVEEFFSQDGNTSYIFTSDHGMTDWGSHGTGLPEETRTPLVAWGAGIRGPRGAGRDIYQDGLEEAWKLSQIRRIDVNQVDIAPLIAVLLGIPIPVNSVGSLPIDILDMDPRLRSLAVLTNARQILSQYKHKMQQKQNSTLSFFFKHFRELNPNRQAELLGMIDMLMKQKRYPDVNQVGLKLIELALRGINYYQKYDRFALNCSVFLGFLGWMAYITILIIRDRMHIVQSSLEEQSSVFSILPQRQFLKTLGFFALLLVISMLLYVQNVPIMYYCYFLIPLLLWMMVVFNENIFWQTKAYIEYKDLGLQLTAYFIAAVFGMELLVLTFFYRGLLSLGLACIAVWPLTTSLQNSARLLSWTWLIACLLLAIFPLLPTIGRDSNSNLVSLAGYLSILAAGICARRPELGLVRNNRMMARENQHVVILMGVQLALLWVATYVSKSTADSVAAGASPSFLNHALSWLLLVTCFFLPLNGSLYILTRLLHVATSLMTIYLLMCITYEGLFLLCLCVVLFLWLRMEHHLTEVSKRLQDVSFQESVHQWKQPSDNLTFEDFRRAYFFIFFIFAAFFGTGNIASLNSFEPSSVYCFLTVFSPFTMGFLLLIKVIVPFLVVSCAFRAILVTLNLSPHALFLLILLMSDIMGLHFFFLVQDTGSWFDIGSSISHYVIVMSTAIFVMLLYGLARVLTSYHFEISINKLKRHLL